MAEYLAGTWVLRLVIGDSILFLGVLYQMMKNLSTGGPNLKPGQIILRMKEKQQSCDGQEARSASFVC